MSFDARAEAEKLIAAHAPPGVAMATADATANLGILTMLLQLLSSSGINITSILAFAVKLVPLVLVRPINWVAIYTLIAEFFKTPPAPVPVNPNIQVS